MMTQGEVARCFAGWRLTACAEILPDPARMVFLR